MNARLDGTRRLDLPPWEPQGFFGRHIGFPESKSARAVLIGQAPRYGMQSSRVDSEVRSGLTRRGVIYEYIRGHPGTHVRGLAKALRLATGDMQYHLLWLEKNGFVKTKKSGFYRFVYPTLVFKEEQEVLLGVLSQETPRDILLWLVREAAMTQSDLARSVGRSQPTISWHMDRLVQLGVVSRKRSGMGIVYEVAADRDDILRFVKSFHPEVWSEWAGRLGDIVVSAGPRRVDEGGPLQGAGLMPPAVVELIGKR